ncbi:PHF5-like protein-domain-containing protein [Mycena metata]|uniref:PHF5-like protein-domain-containing protein n=1 Tax=Mycena metata TaxID=1033252 RepID=A0AAD7IC53_9AGAR|nr:PHF5-like protein-domain-containing protein [Mycena metata]KAJ7739803.1 PHF5-like protein-domain-containing protein [Mycena metata]
MVECIDHVRLGWRAVSLIRSSVLAYADSHRPTCLRVYLSLLLTHLPRLARLHPAHLYLNLCFFTLTNTHPGISDAYYCAECTRLEKDRDGCPKIVNLGASRTDLFYERRRLGFKKG